MSFGSGTGFKIDLSGYSNERFLNKIYSESGNRIIMEVKEENVEKVLEIFGEIEISRIGFTVGKRAEIWNDAQKLIDLEISNLRNIWEHGLDGLI